MLQLLCMYMYIVETLLDGDVGQQVCGECMDVDLNGCFGFLPFFFFL